MTISPNFSKLFVLAAFFISIMLTITTLQATRFARSESKIVDGVNVTPVNKYPMNVAIFSGGSFFCSGTILSKYYVLTSGFCGSVVKGQLDTSYVTAGVYYIGDPDPRYVQNISVKNVTVHARYNAPLKGYFANDIVVLSLRAPFVWNDYVTPTNLPQAGWTVLPNQEVNSTTIGWGTGRNKTFPYPPSRPLQEIELPLITTETCQREIPNIQLTDDLICANHVGGAGTCTVDGGGPYFVYNKVYETYIQIGIQIFLDSGCGISDTLKPDGATKVSKYVHWIEEASRECNPPRAI